MHLFLNYFKIHNERKLQFKKILKNQIKMAHSIFTMFIFTITIINAFTLYEPPSFQITKKYSDKSIASVDSEESCKFICMSTNGCKSYVFWAQKFIDSSVENWVQCSIRIQNTGNISFWNMSIA